MNENINLVEILRDFPKGTPLYSSLHGPVELFNVIEEEPDYPIVVKCLSDSNIYTFQKEGRYHNFPGNEPTLFPSKRMRDWSKFFKKGDVLVSIGLHTFYAIFKEYEDDSYEGFTTAFLAQEESHPQKRGRIYFTTEFSLATEEQKAFFIHEIEEEFGGKLNLDTLEIEKGHIFKPFDMVLVRNSEEGVWKCDFFSHMCNIGGITIYQCVADRLYNQCIPYVGNEHLLGTTNSPEHE